MNDETLKQLLREADGGSEPAALAADKLLAAALRGRRSIARRRTATAAVALLLATTCVVAWRREQSADSAEGRSQLAAADSSLQPPERRSVEELRAEVDRLDREAAIEVAVVRGLATADAEAADDLAPAGTDGGAAQLQAEAERSAAISLQYATLVEQELNDLAAARREYERVARRFPGTRWAELAAVSLERLSTADGPSL